MLATGSPTRASKEEDHTLSVLCCGMHDFQKKSPLPVGATNTVELLGSLDNDTISRKKNHPRQIFWPIILIFSCSAVWMLTRPCIYSSNHRKILIFGGRLVLVVLQHPTLSLSSVLWYNCINNFFLVKHSIFENVMMQLCLQYLQVLPSQAFYLWKSSSEGNMSFNQNSFHWVTDQSFWVQYS